MASDLAMRSLTLVLISLSVLLYFSRNTSSNSLGWAYLQSAGYPAKPRYCSKIADVETNGMKIFHNLTQHKVIRRIELNGLRK